MGFSWQSFGADQEVTGSCHLVKYGGKRILIDCGIFQGSGSHDRNKPPFPFDPTSIDFLVVTHGHLDHIGRIPLLVKEGFSGKILSNRATYELARLSLVDSAAVMASDARRENRRRSRRGQQERVEPLFDEDDIFQALDQWDSHLRYKERRNLASGIELTLSDAGHILGSSSLLLELSGDGESKRVAVSGDLGNDQKPLTCDPARAPKADLAVVESTYGDRDHRSFADSVAEMEGAITDTFARGGNVVIPTFALERAQELLYVLHDAWDNGRIPKESRIFLDSPMAINATGIYRRHLGLFNEEAQERFVGPGDPFSYDALTYTRSTADSVKINSISSGAVILAGSGMVTGGRVLDHLRHNLGRSECSVVFMGYQAEGTKGREIVEGARGVRLHGHDVECKAQVHTIGGFSAHAGQSSLVRWVEETGASEVILVHGEKRAMDPLAEKLAEKGIKRRPASTEKMAKGPVGAKPTEPKTVKS